MTLLKQPKKQTSTPNEPDLKAAIKVLKSVMRSEPDFILVSGQKGVVTPRRICRPGTPQALAASEPGPMQ